MSHRGFAGSLRLALGLLLLCPALLIADVLPTPLPDNLMAQKRMQQDPGAFDLVDQYCAGKKINDACAIPGSAFEGGGAGSCKRALGPTETLIRLGCSLTSAAQIDRALPAADFTRSNTAGRPCADDAQWNKPGCLPSHDPFCPTQKEGQACTVKLTIGGKTQQADGICQTRSDIVGHGYGAYQVSGPVLECVPAHPVPAAQFKPVGLWDQLKR